MENNTPTQVNAVDEAIVSFAKKCFYKGFDKCKNDDANCFTAWREEVNELLKEWQSKQQLSTDIVDEDELEKMADGYDALEPDSNPFWFKKGFKTGYKAANKEQGLLEDLKHTIKRQKVIIAKAAMIIDTLQTGGSASSMIDTWKFMQAKAGK